MRAERPDPSEHRKIRMAFRAATIMKWAAVPLMGIALIVSFLIGYSSGGYFGLAFLLLVWTSVIVFGFVAARCPRCGQVWWPRTAVFAIAPILIVFTSEDETDSFVCRRCHLDIGFGLR
jgi:hypothetical protein